MPDDVALSVIVPVHNARATVLAPIERVRATPPRKQIVIIDDAFTDVIRDIVGESPRRWTQPAAGVADA